MALTLEYRSLRDEEAPFYDILGLKGEKEALEKPWIPIPGKEREQTLSILSDVRVFDISAQSIVNVIRIMQFDVKCES